MHCVYLTILCVLQIGLVYNMYQKLRMNNVSSTYLRAPAYTTKLNYVTTTSTNGMGVNTTTFRICYYY